MNEYKNFWDFLKKTPKNLASILSIWGMCLTMIIVLLFAGHELDPEWVRYGLIAFLFFIMFMGYLRVELIYKKISKK